MYVHVNASRQINKIDEILSFSSRFEQQGKTANTTVRFQACNRKALLSTAAQTAASVWPRESPSVASTCG
jgi:hypothetical protein